MRYRLRVVLAVVAVCFVILILSVSSKPKDQNVDNPIPDESKIEQMYIANMNGQDRLVYSDGSIATEYTINQNGNAVDKDGQIAVRAKDLERAIIIEIPVEVTPAPVEKEEEHAFPFDGSVTKDGVRIRNDPSVYNSTILKELASGTKVTVVGEYGEWYEVKCGELEGYISKTYVARTPNA